LENVYRIRSDYAALARLYEKRIKHAGTPGDRVRMRLDLAKVLEERSNDSKAAQLALHEAFKDDPTDPDVLSEIERLAPITSNWPGAADALDAAVRAASDLSAEMSRDLWMRIAGWRKDKVADSAAAEKAFEEALKHDPQSDFILREIEVLQRAP